MLVMAAAARVSAAAGPSLNVRSLGSRDLAALNRSKSMGFVLDRGTAARLQLLGPNSTVAPMAASLARGTGTVAFALPAAAYAADYTVVYLGSASTSWAEVPSSTSRIDQSVSLNTPFAGAGTYALAQIRAVGR
jgi:hypothetical protein